MRRSANITALIAFAFWFGLALLGRDLTFGVYDHGPDVHPSSGQIDFYIVIPCLVALSVALFAWLTNALQRWFGVLGVFAALALCALLPYLFGYTGGV